MDETIGPAEGGLASLLVAMGIKVGRSGENKTRNELLNINA